MVPNAVSTSTSYPLTGHLIYSWSRLTGHPKLSDANNTGIKYARDCTLILLLLIETTLVSFYCVVYFSMSEKLNTRASWIFKCQQSTIWTFNDHDGSSSCMVHSSDFCCWLIKLLDHNGSHIKGLLINFLDHHYPSLLKIPNFLVEFAISIIQVSSVQ